jgi:CheY-like chemotaxis protein
VAALTGNGQPDEGERIRQAGFDHHLTKPADPKRLYPLIASLEQKDE